MNWFFTGLPCTVKDHPHTKVTYVGGPTDCLEPDWENSLARRAIEGYVMHTYPHRRLTGLFVRERRALQGDDIHRFKSFKEAAKFALRKIVPEDVEDEMSFEAFAQQERITDHRFGYEFDGEYVVFYHKEGFERSVPYNVREAAVNWKTLKVEFLDSFYTEEE